MQIPSADPHPNNYLTFSEALQRSCNVFHETLGERLGAEGVRHWLTTFGLGRPTGIGLRESSGSIPARKGLNPSDLWFASIGQSKVTATPIQMANVCATIARGGTWMRPTLLSHQKNDPDDSIDLQLSQAALHEARVGMINVVNTEAGTGKKIRMNNLLVAGKTGSAQSAPLRVPQVDSRGKPILDEKGRKIWTEMILGTHANPNPQVPWYRAAIENEGKIPSHSWVMCYAPANNPKVAIVAMVEYGGGGGNGAGSIIRKTLEACARHGYLPGAK